MAAAEAADDFQPVTSKDGERPIVRCWFEVQDVLNGLGDGVQANFYELIVVLYQADIAIDAPDTRHHCAKMLTPSNVRNSNLLRALVTQSVFPQVGIINLDECEWIIDDDLLTWTCAGSDAEIANIRGCTLMTNTGVARLAAVCRDLKTFALAALGVLDSLVAAYKNSPSVVNLDLNHLRRNPVEVERGETGIA